MEDRCHHPLERLSTVLQLLRLRQIAVGLDRVAEAGRRLLAPFVERVAARQPIEAVVDLDSVELGGIEFEPALLWQAFRVEDAPPVLVHPARAADADRAALGATSTAHRY